MIFFRFRLIEYLSGKVFHNMLIRFLLESYLQIIICAYINFAKVEIEGPVAVSFSSVFSLVILAFALLVIFHNLLIHRLLLKLDDGLSSLEEYSAFFES